MNRIRKAAAWIGITLLLGIYAVTFILGVFGNEHTQDLFKAALLLTVLVPVLLYAMLLTARILGRNRDDEDERKKD